MTTHVYTQREYGVRTVYVWGMPVSVSQSRGSLVIRTLPQYKGRTVQINGRAYGEASGVQATRSFTHHHVAGQLFAVASFHRLPPGNYWLSSTIPLHGYEDTTLTAGWCDRLDWS